MSISGTEPVSVCRRTVSGRGHRQRVIDVRRRNHTVPGQMKRSDQIVNIDQRVQPRHIFGFDDVTADAQNPAETGDSSLH